MNCNRTELYTTEFRWNNNVLEQRVEIIQHRPSELKDVGIFSEWKKVIVDKKTLAKKPDSVIFVN